MARPKIYVFSFSFRDQTPLLPRGLASAPKFLENSQDKFLANEDENAYVQLEIFGDPAPTVEWFRVRFHINCLIIIYITFYRERMVYQIQAKSSSGRMGCAALYLWGWSAAPRQMKVSTDVFLITDLEGGNINSNCLYQVSKFLK